MKTLKVVLLILIAAVIVDADICPAPAPFAPVNATGTLITGECGADDGHGGTADAVCKEWKCDTTNTLSGGSCNGLACGTGKHRVCGTAGYPDAAVVNCYINSQMAAPECPGCTGCPCLADGCAPVRANGNTAGKRGIGLNCFDPPPRGECLSGCWDQWGGCLDECPTSPIIIDLDNEGFHLTSASEGVTFDFKGNGKPLRLAWTDPKYRNAWLVLDRDGNGLIDSSKEMFGNLTAQPTSESPNGYLALAEFDKPENRGNNNGYIDAGDAVYSKLRLWIDANHDGISQPEELFTLASQGVSALDLKYSESKFTDEFGNRFRYQSILVDNKGFHNGHRTYDVFLVTADKKKDKGKEN